MQRACVQLLILSGCYGNPGDDELLELGNRIRRVPGVWSAETFVYLRLVKPTRAWGVL